LVEGNLIKTIGDETLKASKGATVIDGTGRTLMPGLIDAHVHMTITEPVADLRDNFDFIYWGAVSAIEAEKMLLRGFTTVRDAGGPAVGLQMAIDRGKAVGPRIYPSGPVISQTSGHGEHRVYNEPHPNFEGGVAVFLQPASGVSCRWCTGSLAGHARSVAERRDPDQGHGRGRGIFND